MSELDQYVFPETKLSVVETSRLAFIFNIFVRDAVNQNTQLVDPNSTQYQFKHMGIDIVVDIDTQRQCFNYVLDAGTFRIVCTVIPKKGNDLTVVKVESFDGDKEIALSFTEYYYNSVHGNKSITN